MLLGRKLNSLKVMEQDKKFKLVSSKKTRYLLPNILTLGGVCLGISSIKFSIDGNFLPCSDVNFVCFNFRCT